MTAPYAAEADGSAGRMGSCLAEDLDDWTDRGCGVQGRSAHVVSNSCTRIDPVDDVVGMDAGKRLMRIKTEQMPLQHPAEPEQCHVVDLDAAFGEQLLHVPVGQRES
jgi:hypothetical protein